MNGAQRSTAKVQLIRSVEPNVRFRLQRRSVHPNRELRSASGPPFRLSPNAKHSDSQTTGSTNGRYWPTPEARSRAMVVRYGFRRPIGICPASAGAACPTPANFARTLVQEVLPAGLNEGPLLFIRADTIAADLLSGNPRKLAINRAPRQTLSIPGGR